MEYFKFSNKLFALLFMISSMLYLGCQKEEQKNLESDKILEKRDKSFTPTMSISKESDYLVFNSFSDLDQFIAEANTSSHLLLNSWENQKGIKTQRQVFYNVMRAETNLDLSLENLPEEAQREAKDKEPYYSTEHNEALNAGLIRYYGQAPNSYWDYSLVEPMVASAVNLNGLVKVGGQLIKFSNTNFIYIIKDGNISKLPLAISKTDDFENGEFKVIKTNPYNPEGSVDTNGTEIRSLCYSLPHENTFSKSNDWEQNGLKNFRVKVEIDGRAKANFGSASCVYGTGCTFQVRAQAQKKNFWGNWVYSSGFGPSLTISNATWSYDMSLMPTCSDYPTVYYNNITGGSYPKPIWSTFIPWTNNGFFPMHPSTSGWWVWNDKKICTTINMQNYNIPATYNGNGPSRWNLVK
jgi:hypothetical protein